jgi:hypothetical protein
MSDECLVKLRWVSFNENILLSFVRMGVYVTIKHKKILKIVNVFILASDIPSSYADLTYVHITLDMKVY